MLLEPGAPSRRCSRRLGEAALATARGGSAHEGAPHKNGSKKRQNYPTIAQPRRVELATYTSVRS